MILRGIMLWRRLDESHKSLTIVLSKVGRY